MWQTLLLVNIKTFLILLSLCHSLLQGQDNEAFIFLASLLSRSSQVTQLCSMK